MLALLAALALAQLPGTSGEWDSRITSSAPLYTSGHTSPGPATCGPAFECWFEADAGTTCVKAGGASVAVTQGTAPVVAASPFYPVPGGAATWAIGPMTDANAPSVAAVVMADAGVHYGGDHTVVCVASPTAANHAIPFLWNHGYGDNSNGLSLRAAVGTATAYWGGPTSYAQAAGAAPTTNGSWNVIAARRAGGVTTSRVNGAAGNSTSATGLPDAGVSAPLYLGRYSSPGLSTAGYIVRCSYFPCALTDAELSRIEAQRFGTLAESRNVVTTRASIAWDTIDGRVYAWGNNAGRMHPTYGLLSYPAQSNLLANTTAFDAWTNNRSNLSDGGAAGLTVVTADAAICNPAPDGTSTADLIDFPAVEDLGATPTAFSMIYKSFVGTAASWTDSLYVRAADVSDGGSLPLSWGNGFASNPDNKTCPAGASYERCEIASTLTATNYYLAIGPDTRGAYSPAHLTTHPALSVCVWQAQAELGTGAGPPVFCGASPCATVADLHAESTAGWPTLEGRIEFDYTPLAATESVTSTLLDTRGGAPLKGLIIHRPVSNVLQVLTYQSGNLTTTTSAALAWAPLTTYRITAQWGGGNVFLWRQELPSGTPVLVASNVTGTAYMPDGHSSLAQVGGGSTSGRNAMGYVKLLAVGLPR